MARPGRHVYPFPRPSVTADVLVVRPGDEGLEILLIRRGNAPFAGSWALPGGFVDEHEDLEAAARRELREETGIAVATVREVGMFGRPGRDPRGHTVTVAYLTAVRRKARLRGLAAGDDARELGFFPLEGLPALAFDHDDIVARGRAALSRGAIDEDLLFDLLPRHFDLAELRRLASWATGWPAATFRENRLARRPFLAPAADGRYRFDASLFRRLPPSDRKAWLLR